MPFKEKHPNWFVDDLTQLMRLLEQQKIKPVISKKMPLTDAVKAHQLLEARGVKGKIVLLANELSSTN
ncbi:MAG: zinc-binding dehydrogenase [Anaerolineales bacterium]